MSRSKNSRRGATNRHGGRHKQCGDPHCSYCERNKTIATKRQKATGSDRVD